MDNEGLNFQERGLIEILRAFNFLFDNYYHGKEFFLGGRGNPSIVFYNWHIKQTISVVGDESQSWSIIIQRRSFFTFKKKSVVFDISDYYNTFDGSMIKGKNYTLKSQAEFIQKNLMPVIKGEMWVDELIKQKTL